MLQLIGQLSSLGNKARISSGPEKIAELLVDAGFVENDVASIVANVIVQTADSDDDNVLDYLANGGFNKLIGAIANGHGIAMPQQPLAQCPHCDEFVNPNSNALAFIRKARSKSTNGSNIMKLLDHANRLVNDVTTVEEMAGKLLAELGKAKASPKQQGSTSVRCPHCSEIFIL